MEIKIPQLFKQNNLLKTIDTLSYARYIQREPLTKSYITVQSNVLIYVVKGTKILHAQHKDITIKQGDMFFLKAGTYLMTEVLEDYYEALIFFYSDKLLNDFIRKYSIKLEQLNKQKFNELFVVSTTPMLKNGLLSTIPYFESQKENESIIVLKLEEMFLNILNSNVDFKNFLNLIYTQDENFKTVIETEYENFDSIKDMAKYFKMSELSFREKFKTIFNTTPKKWIVLKKLQKAKALLQTNDLNVSQVCQEVGFDNISWFTQSFKKEFGFTPKEIKNNKN